MAIFRKGPDPNALVFAMTGVQMGERLMQIGCHDRTLLGALAAKVGLSGRAAALVFDEHEAARARALAARAGALVDVETTRDGTIGVDGAAFDLVVVDDTGALLGGMRPETRVRCLQEAFRVLRAGGRIIVVETAERGGLGALLSRGAGSEAYRATGGASAALQAEGFRSVRLLAEREGRRFTEGLKPRGAAAA